MSEEIVKLGKKQLQKGLTYNQVVILFFSQTSAVVRDTIEMFRGELTADEQLRLPGAEEELLYFFLFALDYWWQMNPSYTQEQKRIFDEVFGYHLQGWCGDDAQGRARWENLQERLTAYGGIVNGQTDDSVKLFNLGKKLSDYCGISAGLCLSSAPVLFRTAFQSVSLLGRESRKAK
ncbi:hypothetical protein ACFLW7_03620 [Chloroflexota bacterium]